MARFPSYEPRLYFNLPISFWVIVSSPRTSSTSSRSFLRTSGFLTMWYNAKVRVPTEIEFCSEIGEATREWFARLLTRGSFVTGDHESQELFTLLGKPTKRAIKITDIVSDIIILQFLSGFRVSMIQHPVKQIRFLNGVLLAFGNNLRQFIFNGRERRTMKWSYERTIISEISHRLDVLVVFSIRPPHQGLDDRWSVHAHRCFSEEITHGLSKRVRVFLNENR